MPAEIFHRVTNRRPYDDRPVSSEILDELRRKTPELAGVTTHWITGRERIAAWAEVISEADARMFGEPSMRAAFLSKVRFDAPVKAEVDQGLCLASLEVSAPQRSGAAADANHAGLAAEAGRGQAGLRGGSPQVGHARGGPVCGRRPGDSPQTDLIVGRAMQRAGLRWQPTVWQRSP